MRTNSNCSLGTQTNLRLRVAVIVVLALCAVAAYVPVLSAGWVYDDVNLVQPSPALEDLAGLVRSISTDLYTQGTPRLEVSPYWRPLAMASFWLDTRFGDAPLALHIGNILLHALTTALLAFVLLRRYSSASNDSTGVIAGIVVAATAAAWWTFHPQNVEPVAWISCRYDLLCCVALLCLLAVPWRPGPFRAALYGLMFLAGLLSKEGFGVIAAVVVAMDFADRHPARAAAPRWVAVGLALVIWMALRAAVGIKSFDLPPPEVLLTILRNYLEVIAIYFRRALALQPLTISHPYVPGGALMAAAGAVIIAVLVAAAVLRRRLAVPVMIFLVWFGPVAAAMVLFRVVPERYFYIPSIGLAMLVGDLAAFAISARHRLVRVAVPAVIGVIIILGLVQLEQRLPDWKSDDTLWGAAYRVNPLDSEANLYMAIAAGRRGNWGVALRAIMIASTGDPNSGRIANTYAWVLLGMGNNTGAVREAERATTLAPYQPNGWYYLAFARHKIGDHAGELAAIEVLLQIAPDYPGALEMREVAACEVSGRKDCLVGR